MKEFISAIFWSILIGALVLIAYEGASIGYEKDKAREVKNQKYIDDCIKKDRRVDVIGSAFTKQYLVCNPK